MKAPSRGAVAVLAFVALGVASRPAAVWAAVANPGEDVEFITEHLPESEMNLRYLTLPLAAPAPEGGGPWRFEAQIAGARNGGGFARVGGVLFGLGATRSLSERWGVQAVGFYDALTFSGGSGRDLFRPLFRNDIPLDLPEFAEFSHPQGDVRHFGAGGGAVWQRPRRANGGATTWTFGVLWERLDLSDYTLDYRLVTGRNAGASGVLDHSATYDFVTPYVGWRHDRPLGRGWSLAPRVIGALPLPRQAFAGRITGPGFDLSGETGGLHMGDGYVGAGLAVEHERSGFGIDLGATIYHFGAEQVIHKGIDRPIVLNLTWHTPRR